MLDQWIKIGRNRYHPHWKTIKHKLRTELISQITATKLPVLTHGVDRIRWLTLMNHGCPFLDYRLAEFALSLDKYKIQNL